MKQVIQNGVVYFLYDDNTAEINEHLASVPIHLEIPREIEGHTVVGIRTLAFAHSEEIQSIFLPETIVNIADYAFFKCPNLQTVIFAAGTVILHDWSFARCQSLKEVYGNNIRTANCSFANCHALEKIEAFLADELNYGLFYNCRRLQKVFFAKNTVVVGDLFDGIYPEKLSVYLVGKTIFHGKYQKVLDWPTITVIKGEDEEC